MLKLQGKISSSGCESSIYLNLHVVVFFWPFSLVEASCEHYSDASSSVVNSAEFSFRPAFHLQNNIFIHLKLCLWPPDEFSIHSCFSSILVSTGSFTAKCHPVHQLIAYCVHLLLDAEQIENSWFFRASSAPAEADNVAMSGPDSYTMSCR